MKNYEKRHYFMVAAISLIIFSPVIIWLLPYYIHKSIYGGSMVWIVETPGTTYTYFAIACILLITGAVISFFYYRLKILVSIACIIVAFSIMFIGIKPVTVLGINGLTKIDSPFNEEQQYSWEDVDKAYLIIDDETKEQSLEIHFKDNTTKTYDLRDNVQSLRLQLMELSKTYGFPFTLKD
ncbi:hypothetical protein AB685_15680 [Bacillus sp. LL01]|uniref:hypothetical protein n=1 Tax=Bacillus sp. LL01 TaxID=1665556 RepID=UPI00064D0CE1|nr:hypothetical protein [Bacillus sp. LL01]KMJ57456.1 hypothetical protein AB685_15680 [Bacillus sp. LL01]